ncbi:MAG: hypothetical protein COV67_09410 [Nitrospinae bacterium CG11_big_fil_rev_8_21_14_0_20_56_8]|nr:MAG: hypothetical protein COV67_09410 [Nitrospinae bacterium CG11_big_fil_rev_8_21_14_0_20_56_8]
MKRLNFVFLAAIITMFLAGSAFADVLKPGQTASCNNANSITLENAGNGTQEDRNAANATIWKSSTFTTVPLSLSPADHQGLEGERGVGMANKASMGHSKVTFTKQDNFSRGDSIGDISGEVRITNTGTADIKVNCG